MLCVYKLTGEMRDLDSALIQMWQNTGNPKLNDWIILPEKPANDAVWNGLDWIIPTPLPPPPPPPPAPITARQARLWLIDKGIDLNDVDSAIESIQDKTTRLKTRVEWEFATQIERDNPWLISLAGALGLSQEDLDNAFAQAINY